MAKILEKLWDAFFPDKYSCIFCDAELPQTRKDGICENCQKTAVKNDEVRHGKFFRAAIAPFDFEGAPAEVVKRLKFGGKKYLAKYMAESMAEVFLAWLSENENSTVDLLVPVPLSKKRRKTRGFNQSEELAKHILPLINSPLILGGRAAIAEGGLIVRKFDTAQQAMQTSAEARAKNIEGAFEVTDKSKIEGLNLLIIDDVITTGATAEELAKTLLAAGAKSVNVLTYASTKLS